MSDDAESKFPIMGDHEVSITIQATTPRSADRRAVELAGFYFNHSAFTLERGTAFAVHKEHEQIGGMPTQQHVGWEMTYTARTKKP